MLISKTVIMKWGNRSKKYYEEKGYTFTKIGDEFEIKVKDLTHGSTAKVKVECDNPNCKNPILKPMAYADYLKYVNSNNKYYCNKCATKLFGSEKQKITKFKNSKSFEQWCIENNRQDVLDRWDYELNDCKPSEVSYGVDKECWFKCNNYKEHNSEMKNIHDFTHGSERSIECVQCNSFAQYLIDTYGENALDLYWDWGKNNEIGINPWKIRKCSNKPKVWIKCQEKDYHGSYTTRCNSFYNKCRCPYCATINGKVHPLDSLGKLLEDKGLLYLWSNKNKKSPYKYTPMSQQKVWWKCSNGKHEDYKRDIKSSNVSNFRCSNCSLFKGEKSIEEYLMKHNFVKDMDYIPQKIFDKLIGLKGGNLSYDFYLPRYNLLIEYQGRFHDGSGGDYTKINLSQQQEHDKRKREYTQNNNIKLLEIWYYDFDNIEKILDKELNMNKFKEAVGI